jgi:hypothetical protein
MWQAGAWSIWAGGGVVGSPKSQKRVKNRQNRVKVTRKQRDRERSNRGHRTIEVVKGISPRQFNQPQGEIIMTNKAKAFTVLNTFADSRVALIQGMKGAGYATVEECRPIVIEWACEKMGVGEAGFKVHDVTGKVSLITSNPKYESTKTVVRDVINMLKGVTRSNSSARKEPLDPVAKIIEAFNKLTPAEQRKALKALVA